MSNAAWHLVTTVDVKWVVLYLLWLNYALHGMLILRQQAEVLGRLLWLMSDSPRITSSRANYFTTSKWMQPSDLRLHNSDSTST